MSESESNALPEWIVKRQREKAELDRRVEENQQRALEAAQLIKTAGPMFWTQLQDRLTLNVTALPALIGEELVGNVSRSDEGHELGCHIQVNRQSAEHGPALSKTSLWYQPGGNRIRRWYQDCEAKDITLQVGRDGVVAVIAGNPPMTASQLGDRIVSSMAEGVRA